MRAIVDTGAKISLIYLRIVRRLRILYQEKEKPIEIRIADGTSLIYGDRIVYLEIEKAVVGIEGYLFNIRFNITKLLKEGIILGMP